MHRFARPLALLLLALWLPAMLHCELEAADVHVLTHDDHHHAPDHPTGAADEYHVLKEAAFTAHTPSLKVLPPAVALTMMLVVLAPACRDDAQPGLAMPLHGPPREWRVAWQFLTRAALPARAPDSQLT